MEQIIAANYRRQEAEQQPLQAALLLRVGIYLVVIKISAYPLLLNFVFKQMDTHIKHQMNAQRTVESPILLHQVQLGTAVLTTDKALIQALLAKHLFTKALATLNKVFTLTEQQLKSNTNA